jgi:hypothetical protein
MDRGTDIVAKTRECELRGTASAADAVSRFEDQYGPASARQLHGGAQPVGAAAHHHGIEALLRHGPEIADSSWFRTVSERIRTNWEPGPIRLATSGCRCIAVQTSRGILVSGA